MAFGDVIGGRDCVLGICLISDAFVEIGGNFSWWMGGLIWGFLFA